MQKDVFRFAAETEASCWGLCGPFTKRSCVQADLDDDFGSEVQPMRTLGLRPQRHWKSWSFTDPRPRAARTVCILSQQSAAASLI